MMTGLTMQCLPAFMKADKKDRLKARNYATEDGEQHNKGGGSSAAYPIRHNRCDGLF
jgi:hypothetical protein